MLSKVHIRHLASQHSPFQEQRLITFASTPTSQNGQVLNASNENATLRTETGKERAEQSSDIRVNQTNVRDALFRRAINEVSPSNKDDVDRLFGMYGDRIHELAGEVPQDEGNVTALIDLVREKIGQEIEEDKPFFRDLAHLDTEVSGTEDLQLFCETYAEQIRDYLQFDADTQHSNEMIINTLQGVFSKEVETVRSAERPKPGPQTFFDHDTEFRQRYLREIQPQRFSQEFFDALVSAGRWQEYEDAVRETREWPRVDSRKENVEDGIAIYLKTRGKSDGVSNEEKVVRDLIQQMIDRNPGGKNHFRDLIAEAEKRGVDFYPAAFAVGDKIYFNREHKDFTDPTYGKVNRDRTVVHELTHTLIDDFKKRGEPFTRKIHSLFKSTGRWNDLKLAIDTLFEEGAKETLQTNEDYVHEALSVYLAGRKHPYSGSVLPKHEAVFRIIDEMIADGKTHEHLGRLINELDQDVTTFVPDAVARFDREVNQDLQVERNLDKHGIRHSTEQEYRSHASGAGETASTADAEREARRAAAQKIDDEEEGTKKQKELVQDVPPEPKELLEDLGKAKEGNQKLRDQLRQRLQEGAKGVDPETVAGLERYLDQNDEDLEKMRIWTEDFRDWDGTKGRVLTAQQKLDRLKEVGKVAGTNLYEALISQGSEEGMKAADKATEPERKKVLLKLKRTMNDIRKPIEEITKYVDKDAAIQEAGPTTLWGKIKSVLGPNHVSWLTVWDIVKVVNIFKEAVMDNYHAKQKVRTYDFAKNFNCYQPIQETLKKQARAANEEETHKYLEYLQKEGLTYEDIFKEGGTLQKVRGNINYFKAVMEYCADHAWLYDLGTDTKGDVDGHNVYGVDYIKIWGLETFRELVQKHEGGKKKEVDLGYERVDKFPDVPGIIDAMVTEIHEMNIFRVQGMMKRLQEKAKYPYSNTWMLVTLLNEMRRNPKLLKCFDKGMIDNISNFTITQSTWSVTWLKVLRHELMKWKQNPDKDDVNFQKNVLGETIVEIERLLEMNGTHFPKTREGNRAKDAAIAEVLAARTVTAENGTHITLYDPNNKIFQKYQKEFASVTNTTPTDPKDTDPDYFNPALGGSDLLLLGSAEFARILEHQSQGPWVHQNKATNFVTQIFCRDKELGEKDKALQAEFRAQMKSRFVKYFNNVIAQAAGTENLQRATTSEAQETPPDIRGKYVLEQFIMRDMISDYQAEQIAAQPDRFKALKANRDRGWLRGGKFVDGRTFDDDPPIGIPAVKMKTAK
jgi:vacuolar-type H+-ATPase subunit E/Vma4